MSDEWGLKLVEQASLPVRDGDGKAGFKERELTEVDSGLRQNGLLVVVFAAAAPTLGTDFSSCV
jgi:hypothetical protein